MGWFNKKEERVSDSTELPQLPSLPKLPQLDFRREEPIEPLHQLPSFPTSNLGQKFSQNAIKEAVTGRKESEEDFDADEDEEETQMMHNPLKRPMTKELSYDEDEDKVSREVDGIPKDFIRASRIVKRNEPVFIRIDKFEEGLQIFEKAKKEIMEIEKMLKDTKKLKEEEETQLENWEKEIQTIKKQIEDIDKDIFSKV